MILFLTSQSLIRERKITVVVRNRENVGGPPELTPDLGRLIMGEEYKKFLKMDVCQKLKYVRQTLNETYDGEYTRRKIAITRAASPQTIINIEDKGIRPKI